MQGMERAKRIKRLIEFCRDVQDEPDYYSEQDKKLVKELAKEYVEGKEPWPLDWFRPERDQVRAGDYRRVVDSLNFEVKRCGGDKAAIASVYGRFAPAIFKSVETDTGDAVAFTPSPDVPLENQAKVAMKFMELIGQHSGVTHLLANAIPIKLNYANISGFGQCVITNNTVSISQKEFSNLEKAAQTTRDWIDKGWWTKISPGEEWKLTVAHETGHAVHNALAYAECKCDMYEYISNRRKLLAKYAREIRKFAKQYTLGKTVNAIKKMMSEYGQTNDAEFFAEAFANAMCGEPDIIGQGMRDFLKSKGVL